MHKKPVGKQIVKNNFVLNPKALKQGMRTAHEYSMTRNRYFWGSVKTALLWVGILLGSLLIWNTSVLSETVQKEATLRDNIEQVILSCLNHGGAFINGELHLCKPANTWVRKEEK